MSQEIIKLQNVHKNYVMGDSIVRALDGINAVIKQSEFIAIIGPSGSGKSTNPMIIFGALAFSFLIGALSGTLPALQASRLKPVDALRYE